MQTDY